MNRHATLDGVISWQLLEAGREVAAGEQHNLFLNAGLDALATSRVDRIAAYAAVGTGSAAPAVTDTALTAQVGGRIANAGNEATITRTANGVYQLVTVREFSESEANGNLTEWGFSPAGTGPLSVRELFRDAGGQPVVVTKNNTQRLRITYTLTLSLAPVTLSPVPAFNIDGLGSFSGQHTLISSPYYPRNSDLCLFGFVTGGRASGALYAYGLQSSSAQTLAYNVDGHQRVGGGSAAITRSAYTPGTYTRSISAGWSAAAGVGTWYGVGLVYDPSANSNFESFEAWGMKFANGQTLTKDNLNKLDLGPLLTFSWGRA